MSVQAQPSVVYLPAPVGPTEPVAELAAQVVGARPALVDEPPSEGELIGQLFENLKALRLADALPIEGRAPLAALISVLTTKNGSQL